MSLLDAPVYNEGKEAKKRHALIGAGVTIVVLTLVTLFGFLLGHGWAFSNLPIEHKVNLFFDALEAKDYAKAYGIYWNDPNWEQHPDAHKDYPLKRFTEDWTTESPVNGPITSHHVDISKTDGSGTFGSGVIVAVRLNGSKKVFMWYQRSDGTLNWPAPHVLEY
jgi:hypothetical protein